ncbi:hypothetical protein [Thauera sp. GDN1]|uniref:hypothetical protein n=1 Tax=Thauera sp. GDN1 TaxID=2944810 RepID=UPI0024783A11|nr:hypothetical protein [Thauera sp. GDN1]
MSLLTHRLGKLGFLRHRRAVEQHQRHPVLAERVADRVVEAQPGLDRATSMNTRTRPKRSVGSS